MLTQANDNQIEDINHLGQELGPKNMPDLETVYLEGNPAQKKEGANYRRKVQLALPQISQLDATYVPEHFLTADSCVRPHFIFTYTLYSTSSLSCD